jgi:hypothetical protein
MQLDSLPTNGTATSAMAAESMRESAPIIRERIYQTILGQGLRGCTAAELERVLRIPGNTIRPRLCELRGDKERGLPVRITTMGEMRYTESGRRAIAWIAIESNKHNQGDAL